MSVVSGTIWSVTPEYDPSPVPGDAHLWPGELPFTAWGQHEYGHLDLRVFDQSVYWVDIHQRPVRIEAMGPDYVRNVIAFLEQDCPYFHERTLRRSALQMYGDLLLGRIPTDVVAGALGAPALTDVTPEVWLEATPLMRALRARVRPASPESSRPHRNDGR